MRIISINVHYQDGLGYQDYYLGKEWDRAGHEVHFISSDLHFDFPDYDNTVKHIIGEKYIGTGTFINEYGVPVHRLRAKFKKMKGWKWLVGLEKKLDELKPDIIIMHGVFNFQAIRLSYISKKYNCPIVYDDHTIRILARNDIISKLSYWLFRRLFSKRIYRSATKIIGISSSCLDVLRREFGMDGQKLELISLGSNMDLFYPDKEKRCTFRESVGIFSKNEIIVTYTGKIYPNKKVDTLIETLNSLSIVDNSPITFVIVGDVVADYAEYLKICVESANYNIIQKKAVSQSELAYIYNGTDIAVWPAHATTSTLDASACGCAIICSDYLAERYENNNGIGIVDGDYVSLKNALQKLINNSDLRSEMGKRGAELIRIKHNWKIIAAKFIDS